jgi:hypothetical protein
MEQRYDISVYEAMQIPLRRNEFELAMPRQIREELLAEWTIPHAEVVAAVKDVLRVKNQRRQTIHKLTTGWGKVDALVAKTTGVVQRKLEVVKLTKSDHAEVQAQRLAQLHLAVANKQSQRIPSAAETVDDSEVGGVSNEANPLDEGFDYATYYQTMLPIPSAAFSPLNHNSDRSSSTTTAKTMAPPPPLSATEPQNLDDAHLATLASKLWHSAADSAKAKTVQRLEEETFGDESGLSLLLSDDDDYVDPDSYDDYLEFHRRLLLMEHDDFTDEPDSDDDYLEHHNHHHKWTGQHPMSCLQAAEAM